METWGLLSTPGLGHNGNFFFFLKKILDFLARKNWIPPKLSKSWCLFFCFPKRRFKCACTLLQMSTFLKSGFDRNFWRSKYFQIFSAQNTGFNLYFLQKIWCKISCQKYIFTVSCNYVMKKLHNCTKVHFLEKKDTKTLGIFISNFGKRKNAGSRRGPGSSYFCQQDLSRTFRAFQYLKRGTKMQFLMIFSSKCNLISIFS